MKTRVLPPIPETPEDYEAVRTKILRIFRRELYIPLLKELALPSGLLENSTDVLEKAIQSGQIRFSQGLFTGRLNSRLARELRSLGAKWDRGQGGYAVPLSSLPISVRSAISISKVRFDETAARIDKKLEQVSPAEIAGQLSFEKLFDARIWRTEADFQKTIKGITVAPALSPEGVKRMAAEYSENLQLYIQDWVAEEIIELRKNVMEHVAKGRRYEALAEEIQRSYGVGQRKAKFLAKQETSLLMVKFKQIRYQESGSDSYVWGCVAGTPAHPVRPSHLALKGKTFRWDTPPVTTAPNEPQRRNNPGQDFGCRCFAKPIVRF